MVTDLRVVEDRVRTNPREGRRATWTFKYLIENMVREHEPSDFVLSWLEQWETDQIVGGRISPARPSIRETVIEPWLAASGGTRLDLSLAPFKLLAIVNRLDLRQHRGRRVTSGGEGRFVFGVLGADGTPLAPLAGTAAGGFAVIFEYELPARDMEQLRAWTELWDDLGRHRLASPEYNQALERITRRFSERGSAPGKPNGNALNQIRTNEIALALPWELREFVLDGASGLLAQHTVALTPDTVELNGTPELAALINDNTADLLDGRYEFPASLAGPSSLAGPFQETDFPDWADRTFTWSVLGGPFMDIPWSAADIADNDARHAFALNTCGGCHRVETGTPFLQVGFPVDHDLPRSLGAPAELAGFLTGIEIEDPVDPGVLRSFDDLERRREDLVELIQSFTGGGGGGAGPGPVDRSHEPKFVH